MSYYLGPKFVPFDNRLVATATKALNPPPAMTESMEHSEAVISLRGVIHNYLSALAAVAVFLLLVVLVYFPARPPSPPPGPAVSTEKTDYRRGWGPVRN